MTFDNVEWIFFDVGSTLISEEKPFLHRLHEIAEAVNEPFETIQDKVLALYKEKKKGERLLIQEIGMDKPRWRSEDEELFPFAYTCLERLHGKYKIGVIANQSPGTAARLEKQGILKFIDLVIASAEEGVEKPDRKIFELALSRANCKAENAVMIGDRVDNDIIPAKKIGMKTIRVKQGMWKYWEVMGEEEQADIEVENLSEVVALFEGCYETNPVPTDRYQDVIGQVVKGKIDRPMRSYHPRHPKLYYPVNYGYVEGVIGGDGAEQDIYLLGEDKPVAEYIGKVIAVYHRYDDNETKWIVVPCDENGNVRSNIKVPNRDEIYAQIAFQEQFFCGVLIGI
jgi:8-oxo-dGTP diphosphatase/putative hydrolase of the HAD superfamily